MSVRESTTPRPVDTSLWQKVIGFLCILQVVRQSCKTCNQFSVHHGRSEYAHDEDGDGLCEVHVHTMEGFWSLLRSWLRPHRGISQEKHPLYLGFFAFVHNVRKRGKALLHALMELLVT